MLDLAWYKGREQTFIKHTVLRRYLQKLAYKVGSWCPVINYVDCFAGPWQQASEDLEDTSPFIAIRELRLARDELRRRGKPGFDIRCLFIEKERPAWQLLTDRTRNIQDLQVETVNGVFENYIEFIRRFASVGSTAFTFFFIDPTGWTGYPMETIAPILRHQPGEVLINFMTGHIKRFIDDDRPEDRQTFDSLFGSREYRNRWKELSGSDREDEIVRTYSRHVHSVGRFRYVASSAVLDPLKDRSHFHLIYATRHIEGLRVFRNDAERPAAEEQKQTRYQVQTSASDQLALFDQPVGKTYSDELREKFHRQAHDRLKGLLRSTGRILFEDLEAEALLFPFMNTASLKEWLEIGKRRGDVRIEGLGPRQRAPRVGQEHFVVWLRD